MDILKNFFENFLKDNFGNNNNITPESWNSAIIWVNIKLTLITTVFYVLITFIILSIISINTDILKEYFWYIVIIVGLIPIFSNLSTSSFIELEVGHTGLVILFGKIRGSMQEGEKYKLSSGDYRPIVRIPFHPPIFDIFQYENRKKPMEFKYEKVKTSDGVPFSGEHSALPIVENPYIYADLFLSIGEKEVENIVEEISLEAMNTTFDDNTLEEIMTTKNIGKELMEHYTNVIKDHPECEASCGVEFHSQREFKGDFVTIDGTGLACKFLLKTFNPPEEIEKTYTKLAGSHAQAESIEILAEAEKIKLKKEGEGKAAAEKAIAKATHQVFMSSYKNNIKEFTEDGKFDVTEKIRSSAIHQAALDANKYASEQLISIGNSDGSPLGEGALERILALVTGMFDNKTKKE